MKPKIRFEIRDRATGKLWHAVNAHSAAQARVVASKLWPDGDVLRQLEAGGRLELVPCHAATPAHCKHDNPLKLVPRFNGSEETLCKSCGALFDPKDMEEGVKTDMIESAIDTVLKEAEHTYPALLGRAIVLLSWIKGECSGELDPNTIAQMDKWQADVKAFQEAGDKKALATLRGNPNENTRPYRNRHRQHAQLFSAC